MKSDPVLFEMPDDLNIIVRRERATFIASLRAHAKLHQSIVNRIFTTVKRAILPKTARLLARLAHFLMRFSKNTPNSAKYNGHNNKVAHLCENGPLSGPLKIWNGKTAATTYKAVRDWICDDPSANNSPFRRSAASYFQRIDFGDYRT